MKITINLSKTEIKHLKENSYCEDDACTTIIDIIHKIRRNIQ